MEPPSSVTHVPLKQVHLSFACLCVKPRNEKKKNLIGCSPPFPANFHCKPSVLMVDELLSAYPHQLTFSEAGMRIMITSHFSPRTRLAMASRMLINEVCEHWNALSSTRNVLLSI